jgi:hypothetical protein
MADQPNGTLHVLDRDPWAILPLRDEPGLANGPTIGIRDQYPDVIRLVLRIESAELPSVRPIRNPYASHFVRRGLDTDASIFGYNLDEADQIACFLRTFRHGLVKTCLDQTRHPGRIPHLTMEVVPTPLPADVRSFIEATPWSFARTYFDTFGQE